MNVTTPNFSAVANKPQLYQSQRARRRTFLSQRDADAYDRGAASFPDPLDLKLLSTPFGSGWHDQAEAFNPRFWASATEV